MTCIVIPFICILYLPSLQVTPLFLHSFIFLSEYMQTVWNDVYHILIFISGWWDPVRFFIIFFVFSYIAWPLFTFAGTGKVVQGIFDLKKRSTALHSVQFICIPVILGFLALCAWTNSLATSLCLCCLLCKVITWCEDE